MEQEILKFVNGENDYCNNENSNKNPVLVNTQRDYIAGITSTEISKKYLIPNDIIEAHEQGIIHFHDLDYFLQNSLTNCELINLEDMLNNGFVINKLLIEKPHRLITATTIATQIILNVSNSTYGGATISLTHLAPFIKESESFYKNKYEKFDLDEKQKQELINYDLNREITDAVQTFNYQINTMTTNNGQAAFLTVFMYINENEKYKHETALLIEEFLKQRIEGIKNENGFFTTIAFPKLIYVLDENNINETSEYYYLTKLAAQCSAKRLTPDYISAKIMRELKGFVYPCMSCRAYLTPREDNKYYGRFNQGVITLNLPDVALSATDLNNFWELLDERCELCHRALLIRHNKLKNCSSDMAPLLWQNGVLARLQKHEKITKLLYNNYSTISLGYAGLYECVKALIDLDLIDGKKLGLDILKFLNNKCEEWRLKENISYSVYGTPIESTTYKFAKCLKKRFGEDVFVKLDGKDRNFITNSYHIPVFQKIDAFEKLKIEAEFQKLSPGGCISYIECCDLNDNIDVVLTILDFIYNNIMYAELNTKSDFCLKCNYQGEIKIIDKNNELIWHCPNCGNEDKSLLNVARRTCGYIGTNFFNQGRTEEILNRYVHIDNHGIEE